MSPVWKPAATPDRFGGRCIVEIAAEEIAARRIGRVADQHLAGRAVGHVAIGVVDDAHLEAGLNPAEGARADLARRLVVDQGANHLRHAPELDEREAEALLERCVQLRLDAGTDAEAHAVLALVRRLGPAQQHRHDDTQVVHDGGPRFAHLRPPARGLETVCLHLAVAHEHGAAERKDRCVDVAERQGVVDAVAALTQAARAAARGVPGARGELVAVREQATLGPPGGSRRVQNARRRVRCGGARDGRLGGRRHASTEILQHQHARRMRRLVQSGFELLPKRCQHDDEVEPGVIDHVGELARPVVGVERHAADAERIHGQLVQQVLGPVLEQQADAVAEAVSGVGIGPHQLPHRMGCGPIGELDAPLRIGARRVGRHGDEGVVGVTLGSAEERLADRRAVVDRDHRDPVDRLRVITSA